ncbi:MAG: hypothetical protein E7576_14930 [Ruminococcaceae bacterium]|nr:hypothetical protein [Oscillospiraceae bacterium]
MENTARRSVRRRISRRTAAAFVLFLAIIRLLTGCGSPSTFEGTRTSGETGFWMEYAILDREETADLPLKEGEELQVRIQHTVGDVDVTVGKVGEEPIYKGSGQTNAEFSLTIPKSGTYRISVTGHQAKGSIFFNRLPASEGTPRV